MKRFFLFIMCVTLVGSVFAQNYKITVSSTSGSYSTSKAVSFTVSWTNRLEGEYNSKVWVLIDYKNLTTGVWDRATVTGVNAGTSTATIDANGRGFWLQGNNGAYSQKVTVTLNTGNVAKYNWCANVSDCPPNITANNGVYTFHGTAPFTLIAADGVTKQIVSGKTLAAADLTITPKSLNDATDCPGTFCPYTGSDLLIDASHACQLRTAGAKNWEAWIKDARDNKFYRIVLMPDNRWWLAQNVKLASYNSTTVGAVIPGCTEDECGRRYACNDVYAPRGGSSGSSGNVQGICPDGWLLPVRADFVTMANAISTTKTIVCSALRSYNSPCSPINDTYGWASRYGINASRIDYQISSFYTNDSGRNDGFIVDHTGSAASCGAWTITYPGDCSKYSVIVRCFRAD